MEEGRRLCIEDVDDGTGEGCLRYKLSLRDLVEMMAERDLAIAPTTIMRWVQRFVPELEKRWNRVARKAGRSWRVDETYVKIRGKWTYLYRAVDREGQTVDFRLSITLDGYAASHRAVRELNYPRRTPVGRTRR
ncbi:hypothetical protein E5P2_00479 (plasmid) [Variovorax sp. PBL-E5]|nr:hypothetical protein E5P2_00479 [Variovorax sp. PBL-E5]